MESAATPLVKPEVVFIEDLVEEIAAGRLRVPRFQRPFVWKPSDMLSLFDSIYCGYPIGSLLLWESDGRYETTSQVGPISIPELRTKPITYILDGHQRLATLFGCLRLDRGFPKGPYQDAWQWWIWFDLRTKVFRHLAKGGAEPWMLPVRSVLRTVDFLAEARRIEEGNVGVSAEMIQTAELLAQKIKNYRVALTRIEGGSLNQAVEIFSRLNTKGWSMTVDQMVSALTYKEGKSSTNLASAIDRILNRLSAFHFGKLKRMTIFRAIAAAAGTEIQNTNWESIAKEMGSSLNEKIDTAEASLVSAAKFLYNYVGVPGDELLPYTNQMLMLSVFFQACAHPSDSKLRQLKRWFWSTSFSGWFAGANTSDINHAISEMRWFGKLKTAAFEYMSLDAATRPFPTSFDMRSARVRSLFLVLLRLKPRNFENGRTLKAGSIVSELGSLAFMHVFRGGVSGVVSSPANRVISRAVDGASLRERILAANTRTLTSHAIDEEAFSALADDDATEFVEIRARRMADVERQFLREMSLPIGGDSPAEASIDSDEV